LQIQAGKPVGEAAMTRKLLFFIGIIAAHGALAATLSLEGGAERRPAVAAACVQSPEPTPNFSPPRELLAHGVTPRRDEENEVRHQ
jgi:hypothetical protein